MPSFARVFVLLLVGIVLVSIPTSLYASQGEAQLTFTFDISTHDLDDHIAPLFALHSMPAVMYAENALINSNESWAMNWADVLALQLAGWEIGSHSNTHPNLTTVSDAQLEQEVGGSKAEFLSHGISVEAFSTPFGAYDARVLRSIANHYTSHRAAWGGTNVWPAGFNRYALKVFEPTATTTPQQVKQLIDTAHANREWLILLFHGISDTPAPHEYKLSDLEEIIEYADASPIKEVTIKEGLSFSGGPNLIANPSFETLSAGKPVSWTLSDTNVQLNSGGKGISPTSTNSITITGGATEREILSARTTIDGTKEYLLSAFYDARNLTSGSYSLWIDEFNASGTWVGGKWFGDNLVPFFGTRSDIYKPTSSAVASIAIRIYTDANSSVTLFVDQVELRALGDVVAPPPPPPPIAGNIFTGPFTLVGGATQHIEISTLQNVNLVPYTLSVTATSTNYVSGGWAIWADEFNASGGWVSGKWFGQHTGNSAGVKTFAYTPTSAQVATVAFALYTEPNSNLTVQVGGATLVGETTPPPPPPPVGSNLIQNGTFTDVASGFAAYWTKTAVSGVAHAGGQIQITGGADERGVITNSIPLSGAPAYNVSYKLTLSTLQNGAAVWVNEYNSAGVAIGGQWLGGTYVAVTNATKTHAYTPTSGTHSITLTIFAEPNSNLTMTIDDVVLQAQ